VLGKASAALAHFEDAIVEHERLGLQPQLARSRYELAHMLAESSDAQAGSRARELLEQARGSASRLGMEPLRAAADALLGTLERAP
jgi:hypothetical protein